MKYRRQEVRLALRRPEFESRHKGFSYVKLVEKGQIIKKEAGDVTKKDSFSVHVLYIVMLAATTT